MSLSLKAQLRSDLGRKSNKVRGGNDLPAVLYGKGVESKPIQVNLKDFKTTFKQGGGTSVITLELDGSNVPVLIHDIQRDVVSGDIIHADFYQVDLTKKTEANVPVTLVGESPAEKNSLGIVVLQMNEIAVEALPSDLPKEFSVDVSTLTEVDQTVTVADLGYDRSKVEVKEMPESVVIKVEAPQKEEVAAPVVEPTEAQTETTNVTEDEKSQETE